MHLLLLLRSHGTGPPPYDLEGDVRSVLVDTRLAVEILDTRLAAHVVDTRLTGTLV